jgi:hypothetical protein
MPSTAIRRFRYEHETQTLYVTFVSGEQYAYDGVPPELPRDFRAAFSKGRFFQDHVRDCFPYRRIGSDGPGRAATQPSTY